MKNIQTRLMASLVAIMIVAGFQTPALAQGQITLVVDQQRVLIESLAGKEIATQGIVLLKEIQQEVIAERDQIQVAENELKQQFAILSPEQRQAKAEALQMRKINFNAFAQQKEKEYQTSIIQSQNKIRVALVPILEKIIADRKGSFLVDRSSVMFASPDYDVTADALKALNEALKTVKVERIIPQLPQPQKAAAQ